MQKILVVDDMVIFQKIYAAKLSAEGFEVKTAGDGVEALNHLKNEAMDLTLLDLMMPVMDGFEVLKKLRESSEMARIPVIVFSSRGRAEEIEQAVDLGATGYLVKTSTTPNQVVARVRETLAG